MYGTERVVESIRGDMVIARIAIPESVVSEAANLLSNSGSTYQMERVDEESGDRWFYFVRPRDVALVAVLLTANWRY